MCYKELRSPASKQLYIFSAPDITKYMWVQ